MALGLICFGVYCFFWARHPKVSTERRGLNEAPVSRGGRLLTVGYRVTRPLPLRCGSCMTS